MNIRDKIYDNRIPDSEIIQDIDHDPCIGGLVIGQY